jgi:hypothetical protein
MDWRFEPQARCAIARGGRIIEVRPDGVAVGERAIALEVDLGHVSPAKFKQKLAAYDAFARSDESVRQWNTSSFELLVVTTGTRRAVSLKRLMPAHAAFKASFTTFDELGAPFFGAWS